MPTRRLYRGTTVPFAFRMSPEARTLLNSLAAQAGMSAAHYMRDVWECHLKQLGFDVESGEIGVSNPAWGTRAQRSGEPEWPDPIIPRFAQGLATPARLATTPGVPVRIIPRYTPATTTRGSGMTGSDTAQNSTSTDPNRKQPQERTDD